MLDLFILYLRKLCIQCLCTVDAYGCMPSDSRKAWQEHYYGRWDSGFANSVPSGSTLTRPLLTTAGFIGPLWAPSSGVKATLASKTWPRLRQGWESLFPACSMGSSLAPPKWRIVLGGR